MNILGFHKNVCALKSNQLKNTKSKSSKPKLMHFTLNAYQLQHFRSQQQLY